MDLLNRPRKYASDFLAICEASPRIDELGNAENAADGANPSVSRSSATAQVEPCDPIASPTLLK
jgi:hypothetical protein